MIYGRVIAEWVDVGYAVFGMVAGWWLEVVGLAGGVVQNGVCGIGVFKWKGLEGVELTFSVECFLVFGQGKMNEEKAMEISDGWRETLADQIRLHAHLRCVCQRVF
jgi:hypothetical protein